MSKKKDIYGEVEITEGALWGVNTERSLINFNIGTEKMPEEFIKAMIELKKAAAQANKEKNVLAAEIAEAIIAACDTLLSTDIKEHFPLSIWQTGSGTQTNMNANEIISAVANQYSPELSIHPNDHVNCGQSSNDVFPTSMHICTVLMLENNLLPILKEVETTLDSLADSHQDLLKTARTHLQDAVPISFGQEVSGWKEMFSEGGRQIENMLPSLRSIPIGGTAAGTGLNTYKGFSEDVCNYLNQNLNESFKPSNNFFHAISTKDAFVYGHGVLNTIASNAYKLANDIRWLASGPRTGIGEINIPSNEAGSSIMPGKVNPTQSEALMMVCVQVMANHQAVTMGSSLGNFQLNTFMPLIIYNTWQSIRLLSDALKSFDEKCLQGLTANKEKMEHNLTTSLMTATYLNKIFGYDKTAELVKEAHELNLNIKEIVLKHGLMTSGDFDSYFAYNEMIKPFDLE